MALLVEKVTVTIDDGIWRVMLALFGSYVGDRG